MYKNTIKATILVAFLYLIKNNVEKRIITSTYLKLKALNFIKAKFTHLLLHSYDIIKVFYGMADGLRQSMKFEDFRRLPILVPSSEEQ